MRGEGLERGPSPEWRPSVEGTVAGDRWKIYMAITRYSHRTGPAVDVEAHQDGARTMAMERLDIEEAKDMARKKGLKPGRVKGTTGVQFTKGGNARLEVIGWEEFEAILSKRHLAVFGSRGWMKMMKK